MNATLSLGSNAADAPRRVAHAAAIIAARFGTDAITAVFVTPDIHMAGRLSPFAPIPPYANAVAAVRMPAAPLLAAKPEVMNSELKALERELGRLPEHKMCGLVNIDIDLVTVGGCILRPADFLRPYYFPRALGL